MITFTKADLSTNDSWNRIERGTFKYCIFDYPGYKGNSYVSYTIDGNIEHSIIRNAITDYQYIYYGGQNRSISYSNYYQNAYGFFLFTSYGLKCHYNNFISNYLGSNANSNNRYGVISLYNDSDIKFCNIFGNEGYNLKESNVNHFVIRLLDTNYYGSINENTIRKKIYDFETPGSTTFEYFDLSKRASRPSPLTHGIVWKVEVNGFDAQDEFDSIIPLGVGTHEFKVYFNRAMDTSITPMLAMGVRPPYTQTAISENAYWSADSTIYTAHLTLTGRMPIDGLNRIYVSGAQDDEHFEIPYENQRFNVYVSSSGSMSAGFQATAGIGKVDLEWNDQEVNYEDFLGFNLYRYNYDSLLTNRHYVSGVGYVYDTVWGPTDTIRINQSLLQDTVYTDFNVVPGTRYYYFYKILSTSLTENSPSKTVSCVPNSSIRGDANGSYNVDIADVITTINFVTGQNPQPFLFDAADVNGDGTINVLDIVGIINIILYGDQSKDNYEQQTAIYTIEDGVLYINTPVALGGLQFGIGTRASSPAVTMDDIELLEAMNGFEIVHCENPDGSLTLLAYSMTGKTVPAGKTALLRFQNSTFEIQNLILSDSEGHNVIAIKGGDVGIVDAETLPAQIMKAFPNPFSNEVRLDFTGGTIAGEAPAYQTRLVFYDVTGHPMHSTAIATPTAGRYSYTWNATGMPKGVYFATLYVGDAVAHTVKLVIK